MNHSIVVLAAVAMAIQACAGPSSFERPSSSRAEPIKSEPQGSSLQAENSVIAPAETETAAGKAALCSPPPSEEPARDGSGLPKAEVITANRVAINHFLCGDIFRKFYGSDLASAEGVSFKVYKEGFDSEIGAAVFEMNDPQKTVALRNEILTQSHATIGSLALADGTYQIVFCDAAQHEACTPERQVGAIANASVKSGALESFLGGSVGFLPESGNPLN